MNPTRRFSSLRRFSANLIGTWRRQVRDQRKVIVVVNPGAGQDHSILKTMNSIFVPAGIEWDIDLTQHSGDGGRLARRALYKGADVIGVYGGDGTVTDVASGLIGSRVPLGILPGGTTNMLAISLGIPRDLHQACALLARPALKKDLYLGQVNQSFFTQIIGIGMEARIVDGASREEKERMGFLAYGLSAIKSLSSPSTAHYHLELDGNAIDIEGVTCLVLQIDNAGVPTLSVSPPGHRKYLLDVFVIRKIDLATLFALAGQLIGVELNLLNIIAADLNDGNLINNPLPHWQARQVRISADPPQPVQADGEMLGTTPVEAHMLTRPVQVLIPGPALAGATLHNA